MNLELNLKLGTKNFYHYISLYFRLQSCATVTVTSSCRHNHRDIASGFCRKYHSSNQKLGKAGRLSAQSTCCRMAPRIFHSVHAEPRTWRMVLSCRTKGTCWRLDSTLALSKLVSVMAHGCEPASVQTRFHRSCWSSPVLLPTFCTPIGLGPNSWWSCPQSSSSFWIASRILDIDNLRQK